jgi:hypothetical protein
MRRISAPFWEVRPATFLTGEVGLFATVPIGPGTELIPNELFEEDWTPWNQIDLGPEPEEMKQFLAKWCYSDDEGCWLPQDFNRLPIYSLLNHSCEPNIGFSASDGWMALRSIQTGEELFMDFSLTGLSNGFEMSCRCGTASCRGVIRSTDWQDPEFARLHLASFPTYYREKVACFHGFHLPA